ncbi:Kip1p [Sugiyamaella lignohabitans]|uniref:Kinesin-like protein KIP1 n=1 Tax=Sugiyamaella lignohabitans TaxID=796027 RepID=A0A161HGI8_9ASCO|nr:Kip1p [Sugiyamaella lignohabitans]ANB11921.1 Kip1p [Sugiyamaella lignohabitans]
MTSPKASKDIPNYMKPRSPLSSSSGILTSSAGSDSPIRTPRKKSSLAMNRGPGVRSTMVTNGTPKIRKSMIRNELPNSNAAAIRSENLGGSTESESNIRVYVRCRGRNAREISENSGVVVKTNGGMKNKDITLQTGNTYSNKTYTFDRVFGPEADQEMVYEEVANKSLEEMLQGFNCTVFAYGQTGTGKTYTMTGDIDSIGKSESSGRPEENTGIIPRILFNLFKSLTAESKKRKLEHSIKLSYIELYNEELRDLIAAEGEDDKKVKIYDDSSKKGVVIHGMEEAFVKTVDEAMEVLRLGSVRRHVAATGCNDQSSRSHSVFTITVHIKEISDLTGQEFVRIGKLNLVDLAGSENINRSGAENKRAREAGMINQSLLTLGRVINALVDRSPHIPYRESKLTRILQDSLGGRTKTCIIATISPAKVSLDETLSTLDYASRAKNIKNKPQPNQTMSKQTHLMEYVMEIERLKQDLQSSRQKNGVYLSAESHQTLVDESESRRIQVEEQKMRLDVVEHQLRAAKERSDTFDQQVADMQNQIDEKSRAYDQLQNQFRLAQEELAASKLKLEQETIVRQAHQDTENKLHIIGNDLVNKLSSTVNDLDHLHSKLTSAVELSQSNELVIVSAKDRVSKAIDDIETGAYEFRDNFTAHNKSLHKTATDLIETMESTLTEVLSSIQSTANSSQGASGNMQHALVECENDTAVAIAEINKVKETIQSSISLQLKNIEATLVDHLDVVLGSVRNQYNYTKDFFDRISEQLSQSTTTTNERLNGQRQQVDEIIETLEKLSNNITRVTTRYNEQQYSLLEVELSSTTKEQELLVGQVQSALQDLTSKINILAEERKSRLTANHDLSKQQLSQIAVELGNVAGNIVPNHVMPLLDSQKESLEALASHDERIKSSLKEVKDGSKSFAHQIYKQTKETKASVANDISQNIEVAQHSATELGPLAEKLVQVNHTGYESLGRLVESQSAELRESLTNIETNIGSFESKILDCSETLATELGAHHDIWQVQQDQQLRELGDLKVYTTENLQARLVPDDMIPDRKAYSYLKVLPKTLARDVLLKQPYDENTNPREPLLDIDINSVS